MSAVTLVYMTHNGDPNSDILVSLVELDGHLCLHTNQAILATRVLQGVRGAKSHLTEDRDHGVLARLTIPLEARRQVLHLVFEHLKPV